MLKRRIFFWWGIPLCLLVAFGYAYYMYNKPHRSAADESVAVSIEADSLIHQYQEDEHKADQRYLGKVIEVHGTVADVQHNGPSEIWILSAPSGNGGGINCQLFAGNKDSSWHPKAGDYVKIRGRCTGFLMDVNLADCVCDQ